MKSILCSHLTFQDTSTTTFEDVSEAHTLDQIEFALEGVYVMPTGVEVIGNGSGLALECVLKTKNDTYAVIYADGVRETPVAAHIIDSEFSAYQVTRTKLN